MKDERCIDIENRLLEGRHVKKIRLEEVWEKFGLSLEKLIE